MGRSKQVADAIEGIMATAAAAEAEWELDLEAFEEIEEGDPQVLRPGQLEALVDISSIGYIESNRTLVPRVQEAARNHGVPILFGGFHVRFNKKEQTLLCIPTATYEKGAKGSVEVRWGADGLLHADFQKVLAKAKWKIEPGFKLRVFVRFVRNHPKIGSAMLIPLNEGETMDATSRVRQQNQQQKAKATGTEGAQ